MSRSISSRAQSCSASYACPGCCRDVPRARFRKRLRSGEEIPEWFAFPKVVKAGSGSGLLFQRSELWVSLHRLNIVLPDRSFEKEARAACGHAAAVRKFLTWAPEVTKSFCEPRVRSAKSSSHAHSNVQNAKGCRLAGVARISGEFNPWLKAHSQAISPFGLRPHATRHVQGIA